MLNFGTTTTSVKYKTRALQKFFQKSMYAEVVNSDFEAANVSDPKMKKRVDKKYKEFVVTTLTGGGWKKTDGKSDITYTEIKEVISRLVVDQFLEIADKIYSVAAFASAVDNPDSELINQAGNALYEEMDQAILKLYNKAGAGNWIGTDYTTGTVAVDANGTVTGTGTSFTATMVGKPFQAVGQTDFYRVKSHTSATSIVIENDSDDTTSAYDGGVIAAGAGFVIQAATPLTLDKTKIASAIAKASAVLDNRAIPSDKRWLALPTMSAKTVLLSAPEWNVDIEKVHDETVSRGKVARAYGFDLFFLPDAWFEGDNTNGFHCVGGHKSFITGAFGFINEVTAIAAKDNPGSHSDLIKGLFGHGEKVADERRKSGITIFAKFN